MSDSIKFDIVDWKPSLWYLYAETPLEEFHIPKNIRHRKSGGWGK
jgi:hypothetical protein